MDRWTIALVDDRVDSAELLTYALQKTFVDVNVHSCSPFEVLSDTVRPSAVVTRYRLSGRVDGLELIRQLRENHFKGPILLISNSDELEPRALAAGADAFLSFEKWAELPSRLSALMLNRESSAPSEST